MEKDSSRPLFREANNSTNDDCLLLLMIEHQYMPISQLFLYAGMFTVFLNSCTSL